METSVKKYKFYDYVKTFPHEIFGNLTIIKSKNEDEKYWFIGKEVQNILGFQNLTQAINNSNLYDDETMFLTLKENGELFKLFIDNFTSEPYMLNIEGSETPLFSKHTGSITLISESGFYGLAMNSRKEIGRKLQTWLRRDALPAFRKLFELYNDIKLKNDIDLHLDFNYQKLQSKWYNYVSFKEGGTDRTINNNKNISIKHTNKPPSYWKKIGKEEAINRGIAPSKISSGLDGLRLVFPEESCSISQHKELLRLGLPEEKAFFISNSEISKNNFKFLLDNNILPNELYYNEK